MSAATLAERSPSSPMDEALAPLQAALLSAAEADARATLERAHDDAEKTVADARRQADDLRARARAEGERDAEIIRRDQSARARRRARGVVLAAQSAALAELRAAVYEQLRQAWDDPVGHDAIRSRLVDAAQASLGAACEVAELPDGGIVATLGRARVSYRLTDLADDVIEGLGDTLDRLWSP